MESIRLNKFTKSFGQKCIHHEVSFTVTKGECFALLGGSGTGKSVILRSLIGLEKPDSGEIFVQGNDISHWDERQLVEIRKKVAYVFQNGALFDSMSVFHNLEYPLKEHTDFSRQLRKDKIFEILDDFGLLGSEQLLPSELSGGMKKRVGLARAIITNPSIILYDEPTAGLDPFNTRLIQETILKFKASGVTSILVTHDMPTAVAVCDRFALLKQTSLGAIGSLSDVKAGKIALIDQFVKGEAF